PTQALDVTGVIRASEGLQLGVVAGAAPATMIALGDLDNVSTSANSAADGHVLMYSAGAGEWIAAANSGGGGAVSFTSLTDTPSSYTGEATKLVRVNVAGTGLEFSTQVVPVVTGEPAPTGLTLAGLDDVDADSPTDGHILMYSAGVGEWVSAANAGGGGGGFWTAGTGDDIYYNSGTPRVGIGNAAPTEALDVTGVVRASEGILLGAVAGADSPENMALYDLYDVDGSTVTSPNDGDILVYDGGSWTAAPNAGGGGGGIWTDSGNGYIEYDDGLGAMRVASIPNADPPVSGGGGGSLSFPLLADPEGTPSDPAYSFDGDASTGIFSTGLGEVGITLAGTESVRFTAVGMSINQAADPTVALDITGDIEYTGTITDVSDMRLKTDITPLMNDGSMLAKLAQVETYSFRMKDDELGRIEYGVMAQQLEKTFPLLVHTAKDEMGTKSVNYVGLIAPMIEATKELKAENDNLRAEIAALRAERDEFKTALNDLATDVRGLKAHTGYGINRAEMSLLMLLIALAGGSFVLLVGGIVRNRHRRAE
ncbi:MAG: tail fiber domain-containing protein, partial [Alphaproteobacteria bacterium]|nr:tail fiber domain-containing protein [Alphaproteobacteria bacterium]